MTMNPVGRPSRPEAAANDYVHPTLTGARGLLQDEPLSFELAAQHDAFDRTGVDVPDCEVDLSSLGDLVRDEPLGLPGLSEPETVRHYVRLSQKNHAIDLALYPLGSCT
ncbi:aminomethyl-transferring glycine dehydrogenase subunit GcvPB, partial [Salmonella enterica subsp. enterica serovar Typhimurium]